MPTEALKSAAEFLGRKLMGFEVMGVSHESTTCQFLGFIIEGQAELWQPYADTPEGLWQAKMVVEKMREREYSIEIFFAQKRGVNILRIGVPGSQTDVYQGWEDFGVIFILAAATALGWKEE